MKLFRRLWDFFCEVLVIELTAFVGVLIWKVDPHKISHNFNSSHCFFT